MKAKITFTFFSVALLFAAVVVKAFKIQVIDRTKLMAYHNSQVVREVKIYPKRGHILDRNGNPLAINVLKYNLFTFPKSNESYYQKLEKIKKIVNDLPVEKLKKNGKNRKGKFTWIARKLELSDDQISKLKMVDNVVIEPQSSRMYPNHELAAQALGFVGVDNEGLAGLEYQFNEKLKGTAKIIRYFKDAKGRKIKHKSSFIESSSEDLITSLDKDIQASVEYYLKEGVEKHQALSGGAAVMDAKTGEIWAIANYPSYDPNEIKKESLEHRKLSYVTDPFEPGSVFKTLTIASALENKVVKPDTNYFCERGRFLVGNHYINESDSHHAYEWLSVEDILKFSSNIGTTKIAFDLTYPLLKKTLSKFHIGVKTGIELPGESRGILDDKDNVNPLRLSNISFGQGVATTGIQVLSSYASIANGGYYVRPTVLKVENKSQIKSRKILDSNVTKSIELMLTKAVEDGTGSNAKVSHFTIAGKTSTAQRVNDTGGYTGYIAGFVGYPTNVERKFVVFVYIDNPKKGYYGNTVAAPIFQNIVKNILYKKKEYNQLAMLGKKSSQSVDFVKMKLSARRKVREGEMPNVLGLDKVSAFKLLNKAKLKYIQRGFGIVYKQQPEPGTAITKGSTVKLYFKAPAYD